MLEAGRKIFFSMSAAAGTPSKASSPAKATSVAESATKQVAHPIVKEQVESKPVSSVENLSGAEKEDEKSGRKEKEKTVVTQKNKVVEAAQEDVSEKSEQNLEESTTSGDQSKETVALSTAGGAASDLSQKLEEVVEKDRTLQASAEAVMSEDPLRAAAQKSGVEAVAKTKVAGGVQQTCHRVGERRRNWSCLRPFVLPHLWVTHVFCFEEDVWHP